MFLIAQLFSFYSHFPNGFFAVRTVCGYYANLSPDYSDFRIRLLALSTTDVSNEAR